MSTDLFYYPTPKPRQATLSRALKYKIARKYWGHDGSIGGEPITLTMDDIPYLEGIRDASEHDAADAAAALIAAIEHWGNVDIELRG
jgi:hypothetical protein